MVALSGGPDSSALLLALCELGHDVVAAHFDHALRPGSERDAEAVAELCGRLSVPLVSERRSTPLARGSVMAAARAARYEFLERARAACGAELVATAHTQDDLVETVLINLLRGTGLRGLAGIPERRGRIVRPLLRATRRDIDDHLRRTGHRALDDPSNRDPRRLRARVRARLLPALERLDPSIRERLASLSRAASGAIGASAPATDRATLGAATPAGRAAMLAGAYREVAGRGLRRAHLTALERLTGGRWATGATLDLPGRIRARVLSGAIRLEAPDGTGGEAPMAAGRPAAFAIRETPCPGCDGTDSPHMKPGAFSLGHRAPGLRMRPAGAPGTRKLQDILVDARVPRAERDTLPLVFRDGRLAWVPGIALDPEHTAPRDRPGVHLTVQRLP